MYTMTPLHIAVDKNDLETVNFFMARLICPEKQVSIVVTYINVKEKCQKYWSHAKLGFL